MLGKQVPQRSVFQLVDLKAWNPTYPWVTWLWSRFRTWQRRTSDLRRYRVRKRKRQQALARNRIRMRPKLVRRRMQRARRRVEHSFAEAKQWHGLARARSRGVAAMQIQALMTATVQNMKRLTRFMSRKRAGKAAIQGGSGWSPRLWLTWLY